MNKHDANTEESSFVSAGAAWVPATMCTRCGMTFLRHQYPGRVQSMCCAIASPCWSSTVQQPAADRGGVFLIYVPAGLIVLGVFLVLLGRALTEI